MNFTRRIRTVLYGDQVFTDAEVDLLHTPALQRLYDLHQLGLTDRVFVDASHTRFGHVIGVMHMTDRIVGAICQNLKSRRQRDKNLSYLNAKGEHRHETGITLARMVEQRHSAIRLIGLLHDLTHAPFGHTLEDEIQLVEEKHDTPARQADAFWRLLIQYVGWLSRETLGSIKDASRGMAGNQEPHIIRLERFLLAPHLTDPGIEDGDFGQFIQRLALCAMSAPVVRAHRHRPSREKLLSFFHNLHFAFRALYYLEVAHKLDPKKQQIPDGIYPVDKLLEGILQEANSPLTDESRFEPRRDVYCLDIIGNTICADLLDYARRDSENAGLKLAYDTERIIENFTIITHDAVAEQADPEKRAKHPLNGNAFRTAISVVTHKFRPEVVGELISLLQVRYYVYERMLFHPTKCVAGAALGRAIQLIGWREMPRHLRYVGDAVFLHEVMEAARLASDLLTERLRQFGPNTRITQDWLDREIGSRLPQSSLGVLLACRQIFDDQILRISDVIGSFPAKLFLIRGAHAATNITHEQLSAAERLMLVFRSFTELFPGIDPEKTTFTEEWVERLSQQVSLTNTPLMVAQNRRVNLQKSEIQKAARTALAEALPTLGRMESSLVAGIQLLERLLARRYPKRVFCLMPRTQTVGHGDLTPEKIAPIFLDPKVRLTAESAIEDRAGLPRGSVVIHCPLAKGPQKLAEVYVTDLGVGEHAATDTKPPTVVKLNAIDKLAGGGVGLFREHHHSIKALERMYASMWRLSVGVCSPHDKKHAELATIIGKVLAEVLTEGANVVEPMKNDPTMLYELANSYRSAEGDDLRDVVISYPDGQTKTMPESVFDFSEFLVETMSDVPGLTPIITEMRDAAIQRGPGDPHLLAVEARKLVKKFVTGQMRKAMNGEKVTHKRTSRREKNRPQVQPDLGLDANNPND